MKSPYMREEKQTAEDRFTKEEKQSLKVFKDNTDVIKLLRNVFYQLELSDGERSVLSGIFKDNDILIQTFRKVFIPEFDTKAPIFQQGMFWMQPNFRDLLTAEVRPVINARKKAREFLENGIKRLERISKGDFESSPLVIDPQFKKDYEDMSPEEVKRDSVAVQESMTFFEGGLFTIQGIANQEEETPEQVEDRQKKDSAK